MKKLITTLVAIGLVLGTMPASAGSRYASIRAAIAESMQWRMTFLPTTYQASDVFGLPGFEFQGAATLERTRNGIKGELMTNVDAAGEPYTLWVVVINNPGACSATPCPPDDLLNPETEASAHNGTAAISAANGNGGGVINVAFETVAGPLPDGQFVLFGEKPGLHRGNGFEAEIQLVVDSHSPRLDPGSWVADLTTTDGNLARNHRFAFFAQVD